MRIADVMLNKRLDELADLERALRPTDADAADSAYWDALEQRAAHLRTLCRRGLSRCYPDLSMAQIEDRLMVCVWINR